MNYGEYDGFQWTSDVPINYEVSQEVVLIHALFDWVCVCCTFVAFSIIY